MNDDLPEGAHFVCVGCDAVVFQFGRDWCPVSRLCCNCEWLAGVTDPRERAQLRQLLDRHNLAER